MNPAGRGASPRARLVFIYGPPGVGKLSVARELVALTGYALFDNHMSIDWASAVLDRSRLTLFDPASGGSPYWRLVERLRLAVFEEAARAGQNLVTTFVYGHDLDLPYVRSVAEVVTVHGGTVHLVHLTCDRATLERRVEAAGRAEAGKLASAERLRESMARVDLWSAIPGSVSLEIDNTARTPRDVATEIATYYELLA